MPELEAFFHDLRALRASAGLSLAELAGRAHYPQQTLAAAESGPAVPPNPVLVAYVQACGGPVGPWEDRWRAARAAAPGGLPAAIPAPAGAPEPAAAPWPFPPPSPPRRRRRSRAVVALAAAAAALAAAGTAVALTRPAAHPAAGARPRTSPSAARPAASRRAASSARPQARIPATSAPAPSPPTAPVMRVAGVGCPASPGGGVTLI